MAERTKHPFRVEFSKFRLRNGLTVIVHEDHRLPQAAVNVWYHVGSKNEAKGKTGFAHLFEHLMFQGSEHYPDDYFKPLEEIGARLNGSTAEDRTNYWEVVPVAYLGRALWLESDRMGWLPGAITQEKLDNQREVVKNERRQTMDNQPYGAAEETMLSLLYPEDHPYHHSVIGSMDDLDAATLDDVKDFFRRYYTPRNASVCVAGDVDTREALSLVEKYFGEIPPGPIVAPIERCPPVLRKNRRVELEDKVALERIYMEWPTVPHLTADSAALSVLSFILTTGKDSRLGRTLQLKSQVAQSFWSYQGGGELAGSFQIGVTVQNGRSIEEVEETCRREIAGVIKDGVSSDEVRWAVDGLKTGVLKRLQMVGGFGGVSDMLNYYQTFTGDPGGLENDLSLYETITPAKILEVAEHYLHPDRYAAVKISPEGASFPTLDRSKMPQKGAESVFAFRDFEKKCLPNGLELWLMHDDHLPMVTVSLLGRVGSSRDPEDKPGLAQFCAGLMDESAAGMGPVEMAGRQKKLAASLSTTINRDHAAFSLSLIKENFSGGLELIGDVILKPDFREEDSDRLKKEMIAGLTRNLDDPSELGDRTLWAKLFGERSPYGHPIDGSPASIARFSRGDALEFYRANYRPDTSLLVVVGNVSASDALEEAERGFGEWSGERGSVPEADSIPASGGLFVVDKPGAPQTYVACALPSISRTDPVFPAFVIFNAVLGGQFTSRINMNLREDKGYTYGAVSQMEIKAGVLPWTLRTSVQSDKTVESLIELKKEFSAILTDLTVSGKEFVSARDNYLLRYPQRFETFGQLAAGLADLWMYGLPDDYHQRLAEELRALTLEDVVEAGRRILKPDNLVWVVVGDGKALMPTLEGAGLGQPVQVRVPGRESGS